MKDFFWLKRLCGFTDTLSSLVGSGLSLQKSLAVIEKIGPKDKKLSLLAKSLSESVSGGTKFSVALKMQDFLYVPEWYVAYISVAEGSGDVASVLVHLESLLLRRKETGEKVFVSLFYPCSLFILAAVLGFLSLSFLLPESAFFSGGDAAKIKENAVRTMIFADLGLLLSFFFIFGILRETLSESPCAQVFRSMAFLTDSSVPTLPAVSCAVSFCGGNKKLTRALLSVRESLLEGEKISDCFGLCFEKAGFRTEGILLSENLSVCEKTGGKNGFEKTAAFLESRKEKKEKAVLSALQPVLLFLAAVYIGLILKTAFLPYLTNFGGLL